MTSSTPAGLLVDALADNRSRPLLTYLDESTGERTEVSVTTFDNWVAKTANLLVDDLAVEPGARVALLLPLHWQSAVWLAACWATGCVAVPDGDPAAADVVVAHADQAPDAFTTTKGDVLSMALRPLAVPGAAVQPGVTDYDVEIRSYGDRFSPYAPVPTDAAALEVDRNSLSGGALVEAAERAAQAWGRPRRLLTTWPPASLDGVLAALVVPLLTGGSAVLVPDTAVIEPERLAHIVETEQVDAVAGLGAPASTGARTLSPAH